LAQSKFDDLKLGWKRVVLEGSKIIYNVIATCQVKYGMRWGCFGYFGVGLCCEIYGQMNGKLYREILADKLIGTMSMHNLYINDVIFQHNPNPKHAAHETKRWLSEHRIRVLDWPAYSQI